MAKTGNPYNLSDLRWRFAQEYVIDLNGTAAYQRAGYKASEEAARRNAARLLTNADVSAAIQDLKIQHADTMHRHLRHEAVIEEIALMTHSSVEHYCVDDHGNLTLAPGAPANALRAVSGLKKRIIHTEQGIIYEVEFKLWNKPASTRMAGEHLSIFQQQQVVPDIHVHVGAARDRVTHKLRSMATRQEAQA